MNRNWWILVIEIVFKPVGGIKKPPEN